MAALSGGVQQRAGRRQLRGHLEDLPGPDDAGRLPARHHRGALQPDRHELSSKSELALNLSPDGKYVSFMGYVAQPDTLDVSNSNTPGVIDPTNPVPGAYYREVALLARNGKFGYT